MQLSHTNTHRFTNVFTVDLWDSSLSPQRTRTQRNRESCHIVTNSLASSCLNTHSHAYRDTLCRSCSSGESAVLPWWWGVMSQHLPEKGGSGNVVYSQKHHSGSHRCKKIQSARYFHVLQSARIAPKGSSNQPPHLEDHSNRDPRDVQHHWGQTRRSSPQFKPTKHTHIHAVPTVNNNEKHFHWGTEAGSQQGVTRGREEKHSATHTHTRAHAET